MASTTARPVQTLREHATNFEAAISVCLGGATHKAVHKLRTESRRLEAQIALLNTLHGLPPHRTEAAKTLRHLKKLRQAAGKVRDLDVQTKLLEEFAGQHKGGSQGEAHADNEQRAADLRNMMAPRERRREDAAEKLLKLLEKKQAKVTAALEALLKALKPAENMRLSGPELLGIVEKRFARNPALKRRRPSHEGLHDVRKAAKQSRYMAETAESRTASTTAKRYEDLQEAGGQWHDWLDLASAAKEELGGKHVVTREFKELRDRHLASYCAKLEQFR